MLVVAIPSRHTKSCAKFFIGHGPVWGDFALLECAASDAMDVVPVVLCVIRASPRFNVRVFATPVSRRQVRQRRRTISDDRSSEDGSPATRRVPGWRARQGVTITVGRKTTTVREGLDVSCPVHGGAEGRLNSWRPMSGGRRGQMTTLRKIQFSMSGPGSHIRGRPRSAEILACPICSFAASRARFKF